MEGAGVTMSKSPHAQEVGTLAGSTSTVATAVAALEERINSCLAQMGSQDQARDALERRLEERHTALLMLLNERQVASEKALMAALSAQRTQTDAAFNAAEKAEQLSRESRQLRDIAQNEWRGTLDDYTTRQMPRTEADGRFAALESRVTDLKDEQGKDRERLKDEALAIARGNAAWMRGALLTAAFAIIGWGVTIALFLARSSVTP